MNAGVRLSAVQKAKALLPPEIQRAEDDAAEILLTAYTGKFGRTDAGTAAGLLLAALIDNSRASSNSNSANIVLKSTKPADLPDYKAAAQTVADILRALASTDADHAAAVAAYQASAAAAIAAGQPKPKRGPDAAPAVKGSELSYWTSPAHLIPAAVGYLFDPEFDGTEPAEFAATLASFDPAANITAKVTTRRGKGTSVSDVDLPAAWMDRSNAARATTARAATLKAYASGAKPKRAKAAEVEQAAAAIAGLFK